MFQFNPEKALQAGASSYIQTSGAYKGKITKAKWVSAKFSNAQSLELSFESEEGQIANFINIWYKKADGTESPYGEAHIHALMGLLKLQNLSQAPKGEETVCPELQGKPIGLILQKVLSTKDNGEDTYKFDLVLFFGANSGKTYQEAVNQEPAQRVTQIAATLKDKDERKRNTPTSPPPSPPRQQSGNVEPAQPLDDIDDDIPF